MLHDFLILPEKKTKRTKTEREGFEPSVIRMYYNGFRVRLLRPLGHLSIFFETKRIRTSDPQFRKLMLYPAELWSHRSERGGFEPPDPGLAGQLLSREPDSASLAPLQLSLTEREGFEPPETCASTVFKTASFDRSDISPLCQYPVWPGQESNLIDGASPCQGGTEGCHIGIIPFQPDP